MKTCKTYEIFESVAEFTHNEMLGIEEEIKKAIAKGNLVKVEKLFNYYTHLSNFALSLYGSARNERIREAKNKAATQVKTEHIRVIGWEKDLVNTAVNLLYADKLIDAGTRH